jgi:phosphoribosyl 1,2-cyclic phosphodiesterase/CheY-like chemotaxis protein
MQVRFWGTRGSIATPGPSTIRYGGNTSCVEIRSARGALVLLDCGTGARALGRGLLLERPEGLRGHILISHTHWDHIQGIPFFGPLSAPGAEWDIYAPRSLTGSVEQALAGQMQYTYFPVALEQRGATIRYHELVEGSLRIGDIDVTARYLNHPGLTLGYRLEADGVAIVYACDHEPHSRHLADGTGELSKLDRRHAEFLANADLVIHDAQYVADEYPQKLGWGHSTVQYAVRLAIVAGARRLALTHHDPLRSDDDIDALVAAARQWGRRQSSNLEIFAAAEGQLLELADSAYPGAAWRDEFPAMADIKPALVDRSVLLAIDDAAVAEPLAEALSADGLRVRIERDGRDAVRTIRTEKPSMVIAAHDLPGADGYEICGEIRREGSRYAADLPIILIAPQEGAAVDADTGVTEWLVTPFLAAYVRTRVRAWLMRAACRRMRAAPAPDREHRLIALHRLGNPRHKAGREVRSLDAIGGRGLRRARSLHQLHRSRSPMA